MRRGDLIRAVRAQFDRDAEALARMLEASRHEATGSESRAENKYDTRAIEASYLAAGQGRRLAELRELQAWAEQLDERTPERARLGAAARIEDRGTARWVLLAPSGGPQVQVDGTAVTLISARAPLGRALLGLQPGDAAEVDEREIELLELR